MKHISKFEIFLSAILEFFLNRLPMRLKWQFKVCMHPGCGRHGEGVTPCDYPCHDDEDPSPDEWLCAEHAWDHGFCWGCGGFWAGVESFDFGHGHLCENCAEEFDDDDYDEDYDFESDLQYGEPEEP